MIRHEANYVRKAHRVTIPIYCMYNQHLYSVKDWSSIGLGIQNDPETPLNIEIGDTIEASLILPTGSSSISLRVSLELKNIEEDIYGFTIAEMEEKNRRVLRHYATLAIEGDGDRLEDLTGDLLSPVIQSPIKETIALTSTEDSQLRKEFNRRLYIYFASAAVLILFALYAIAYNYTIRHNGFGVVAGNLHIIKAPIAGVVSDIFVTPDEPVFAGTRLLDITDKKLALEAEATHQSLKQLNQAHTRMTARYRERIKMLKSMKSSSSEQLVMLEQNRADVQRRLNDAQVLFDQRIITGAQLDSIRKELNRIDAQYIALQSKGINPVDYPSLRLQNEILNIEKTIAQETSKSRYLDAAVAAGKIKATGSGTVYSLLVSRDQPVKIGDALYYVQTDAQPFVLTKLHSKDAKDVAIGQPCVIASTSTGRHYNGRIDAIGYAATGSATGTSFEIAQNEVPLRIRFDDNASGLPLYSRLDVWVLRPENDLRRFIRSWLW